MGVYIKGMEMPKNCMSCPFPSVGVDWYYCYCPGVDGKAYDFEQSNTVPDDCPLVALPDKHGRLVDADALIEFIDNRYDVTWKDDYEGGIKDACTDILEKIDTMPTIVEAEGENADHN